MCFKHNRWTPLSECELCKKERLELERAIMIAEIENSKPIVLWDGINDN